MGSPDHLETVITDPAGHLAAPGPADRRLAVSALVGGDRPLPVAAVARMLAADPEPEVRAEAAEALGTARRAGLAPLLAAVADPSPRVVEAVAFALGEVGASGAVPWLLEAATEHTDKLVREAAVASLGAIGDERARPVLLDLVGTGPPQVRRRCVVALTAFDGPDIEAAMRQAASDRNPMVREAAEMVVGPSSPACGGRNC